MIFPSLAFLSLPHLVLSAVFGTLELGELIEDAIREFIKKLGLTFEVLHDAQGNITRDYQATGYPETFVIGRDGVIRKKVIGAVDWHSEGNRALVRQLLAERAG